MKYFYKKKQEKGTSFIKSMPQSAQNDTYNFCKNSKKCTKNLSLLRKARVFKALAASGLALFMGIGTLCGVLLIPINAAQASVAGGEALTPQEQLLAGTLKLDPENDPVVFTTDSGLEIKFGAATLSSGALSGYTYFTMGQIGNNKINWVIVGRSSFGIDNTMHMFSYLQSISERTGLNLEFATPAGSAIKAEEYFCSSPIQGQYALTISTKEVPSEEIPQGCVLALSECVLSDTAKRYIGKQYEGSAFQESFTQLYNTGCGFTAAEKSLIQPVTLQSPSPNGLVESVNQYLFAPGSDGSDRYKDAVKHGMPNFCIQTYLSSYKLYGSAPLIGTSSVQTWGLRNTWDSSTCCVYVESQIQWEWASNTSLYPRAFMVLKI